MTGNDLRRRWKLPQISMTGTNLKIYGCVTMAFYSISMSVIQHGMLHVDQYSNVELREMLAADPELMLLSTWGSLFQLVGGLAIPVFAFLLVEGFQHTRNFRAYLLRMLAFAAVSEIPYDFAMSGRLLDWSGQNMLFTLSVCLVMLYGLRMFSASRLVQVLIVVAAVFWVSLMKGSFGLCMVLLAAAYYVLCGKPRARMVAGSIISLMYVTGPLSTFALRNYNGQRGDARWKYLFYVLYPLHLVILGAITYFLV